MSDVSAQNKSPHPRWALIHCYTASFNVSSKNPYHPQFQPMPKVPDAMIRQCQINRLGTDRLYARKEGDRYMKESEGEKFAKLQP